MLPTFGMVAVWPGVNVSGVPLPSVSTVKPVKVTVPSTLVPSITLPVFAVSSGVVAASLASVKLSFTGVIESVSVEVSVPPAPSLTV